MYVHSRNTFSRRLFLVLCLKYEEMIDVFIGTRIRKNIQQIYSFADFKCRAHSVLSEIFTFEFYNGRLYFENFHSGSMCQALLHASVMQATFIHIPMHVRQVQLETCLTHCEKSSKGMVLHGPSYGLFREYSEHPHPKPYCFSRS